jgi:hypothetical protein
MFLSQNHDRKLETLSNVLEKIKPVSYMSPVIVLDEIRQPEVTGHKRVVSTMVCGPFGGIYPYPSQAHNLTGHKRVVSTMVCGPFGGIYPYPSQEVHFGDEYF